MAYKLKTNLAHRNNYGSQRKKSDIKYIVVHYTANDGDSDESNANYFKTERNPKASAHYFVDDDSVTQSVPDDYVAYSVGGSKYSDCASTGGGKLYGLAKNANTLNIELCDTKKDGTIKASEQTLANAAELIRTKMQEYSIDVDHVIRHFDVNGKHCPAYFMDAKAWNEFKERLTAYTVGASYETTADCYIRLAPGTDGKKLLYAEASETLQKKGKQAGNYIKLCKGETFKLTENRTIGSDVWGKIKSGYWVPLRYNGKERVKKA
jgi:N-acetylmuramoyl-L-alanine amidase CwlA